jgi:hypothetical protein
MEKLNNKSSMVNTRIIVIMLLTILNVTYIFPQKTVYKVGSRKMSYDITKRSVSNSKNKLNQYRRICESLYCDESVDSFYPFFLEAFSKDTIREYAKQNVAILINAVCNKKKEIVEISFNLRNRNMSEGMAKSLAHIERKTIGKTINFSYNCPNNEYFFISWVFRFAAFSCYTIKIYNYEE